MLVRVSHQPRFKLPNLRCSRILLEKKEKKKKQADVFLTMWMLPAGLPSSDNRCRWRRYRRRHKSPFHWSARGCGSSSASSRPSPWSDSHWTDAAFCGPSLGLTWMVDLGKKRKVLEKMRRSRPGAVSNSKIVWWRAGKGAGRQNKI